MRPILFIFARVQSAGNFGKFARLARMMLDSSRKLSVAVDKALIYNE